MFCKGEVFIMKVFVSWSGELSCQIAEVLKNGFHVLFNL